MSGTRISNLWGKITIFLIICCFIIMGLYVDTTLALDGSGTQEDPWRIQSLADFNDFAADANYWDDYTRLETDVNLAGRVYNRAVIGWDVNDEELYFQGTAFTGVFDGNDHKITNLTIDGGGFVGLFGYIDDGQVRNLGLEGGSLSGTGEPVGGLVGFNRGSLSNCHSTSDVSGNENVGGLSGFNMYGTTTSCYSTGDVNGVYHVGGLVGHNGGGSLSDCYATGDVKGDSEVGGLVGGNGYFPCPSYKGIIRNCFSTGDVSGDGYVGGLVGLIYCGIVLNCYSTGDVSGDGYVGGLVGGNLGAVSNCYSTGDVNGVEDVGGLVGYNPYYYGTITVSYWDTETSGEPNMCGNEHPDCNDSYGKTTAEMHQQSTFIGWDFINVWNIGENQTYPYLRTVPAGDINKDGIVNFLDVAILGEKWMDEE